jgi:hypothetical protein
VTYNEAKRMMDEGRLVVVRTPQSIDMVRAVCPAHRDEEFAARMARFNPADWGLTWEEGSEGTQGAPAPEAR